MSEDWRRPPLQSITEAYHHLFSSGLSLSKIKDAALAHKLFPTSDDSDGVAGRSLSWKLFLNPREPLQSPLLDAGPNIDLASLRTSRKKYADLLLEKLRAPDGSYEGGIVVPGSNIAPQKRDRLSGDLETNNPLSLHNENPWTEWFASVELRKTISQDVERTFPEIVYFREPEVQQHLTNILFIYSVTNPTIGYRQGMHELLAPLYFAVDFDSIASETDVSDEDSVVFELCSRLWVAADAWVLFDAVMRGVSRWYEWRQSPRTNASPLATHVQLNVSDGLSDFMPYVAPIVEDCNRIQSVLLKSVDPLLFNSMQTAGIEPQIYGIRWLRLLFTREFSMHDAMILWDGLFACDPTFELAQWICVAMLIRIRNHLLPSDYSGQLTYLLRYPSPSSLSTGLTRSISQTSLLIRQALVLQMSPTPSTGASVSLENNNFLNIPLEIPDRSPPPSAKSVRDRSSASVPRSSVTDDSANHSRQHSTPPLGLPEMIARGLLDRGESLGINKTLMNAVTELKRNIPEISSLVRIPMTTSTHNPAFPLTDERSPDERPPWEPRSRLEMEREITELRAMNRKLGKSVGWIVDVLLQDESESKDPRELNSIKIRKREALESLSYVRDILIGNVGKVDDEQLVGEEELKARRSKESARHSGLFRAEVSRPATVPVHESRPKPASSSHVVSYTREVTKPTAKSSSPSRTRPTSSHFSPPGRALTPPHQPANSSQQTRFAPWNYTRSNFSTGAALPAASLPRLPPPTSANFHPQNTTARVASRNSVDLSQAPTRAAQHDPLGVLQ